MACPTYLHRACILVGSSIIPSAISDTGATASAFKPLDPKIHTGIKLNKTFGRAFWEQAAATTVNKLHRNIQEPAQSVHIVPQVQHSLLSTSKLANADYIGIYDKHEINFYNAQMSRIIVLEESVLKGWQCPVTNLWHVPLVEKTSNFNTDTLILDHPLKVGKCNKVYEVQTTKYSRDFIKTHLEQTNKDKYVHNVYKLPSMEKTVRYPHAAAGHPTKETWLRP